MPDWLYQLLVIFAIFGGIIVVGYITVHFLGKMLLAFLIDKGMEIAVEHGPPTLQKAVSAVWRNIYPKLPRWAQRVLPTPKASTPRRSGPVPQGGTPVAVNPNPANPAGAGQAAAQQPTPQNDGWPNWMSALAPIIVAILVFAALLVANLTPLYYTGMSEQMPHIWVAMQFIIALLVGSIVWLVVRINALRMDILFMQTTHPQLKRPDDWTPPAPQPQAPAQQPNP